VSSISSYGVLDITTLCTNICLVPFRWLVDSCIVLSKNNQHVTVSFQVFSGTESAIVSVH